MSYYAGCWRNHWKEVRYAWSCWYYDLETKASRVYLWIHSPACSLLWLGQWQRLSEGVQKALIYRSCWCSFFVHCGSWSRSRECFILKSKYKDTYYSKNILVFLLLFRSVIWIYLSEVPNQKTSSTCCAFSPCKQIITVIMNSFHLVFMAFQSGLVS